MANPFKTGNGGGKGPMQPGDIKTVPIKDFKTNEDTGRFLTIHRTERDYCHDLCDAYNEARTNPDVEWYVLNGQVQLGRPAGYTPKLVKHLKRHAEQDRLGWIAAKWGEVREAAE